MKKVAPLVALWLPLGSQKDCKSLWPHRLAARTLASHAGNLGTKTDNSGEISSIKIIAWLVPSFLRMKKKGLPSGCPFFIGNAGVEGKK
tara:strand:- start:988 stop:1254 length:267 start_codon:yes stop_codon:yes gene_type:complete